MEERGGNERMSGGTAERKHKGVGGRGWPRVEVRHRGWRERWRNKEQAGLLKRMRPNSS